MNLAAIRSMIRSVLDYEPDNTAYDVQVNDLINAVYDRVIAHAPWVWSFQTYEVVAKPDSDEIAFEFTNGTHDFKASPNVLDSDMDGHYIEIDGVAYRIGWVEDGSTGWLLDACPLPTDTYTGKVVYRYAHLPPHVQTIHQVFDRSVDGADENGVLTPIARSTEERHLALNTTGTPYLWCFGDSDRIPSPRKVSGLATTGGIGQGARTLEFAMSYVWGGRESALSPVTRKTYTATEVVTWTPDTLPGSMPYYRRLYVRSPDLGIFGWRMVASASTGQTDVSPLGGVTITPALQLSTIESESWAISTKRYGGAPSGVGQRIRLYPRTGDERTISVRGTYQPARLEEDQDTPIIPVQWRAILAHWTLVQLCLKHDQAALANVHQKQADILLAQMVKVHGGEGHKVGVLQIGQHARPNRVIKGPPAKVL